MVNIRPFKALIYNIEKIRDINLVVSPPYDVISEEYKKELKKKSDKNIVSIILPDSYEKAGILLNEWIRDKTLIQTEPSLFVYGMEFSDNGKKRILLGLIALLELTEFWLKEVIPHELTFQKAIQDRLSLIKETEANFSPLFMIYEGNRKSLDLLKKYTSQKPLLGSTDPDGVVHKLWKITDKNEISIFSRNFQNQSVIIADGHHRYKTALMYSKSGGSRWIMTFIVDFKDPGLRITTPCRLVKKLPVDDLTKIKQILSKYFNISEFSNQDRFVEELENSRKGTFGAFIKNKFLLMKIKKSIRPEEIVEGLMSPESKRLDVVILHKLILAQLLGIHSHGNLSFSKKIDQAIESVKSGENQAVFFLKPVTPDEIKLVTQLGEVMPQKSTYFYPKPLSGLVIYKH